MSSAHASSRLGHAKGRFDIVIVSYETPELLDSCLHSIAATERDTTNLVDGVFVVDNSITSGCSDVVQRDHPSATLIRPPENLGFGSGANVGVAAGHAEFVLVLNADTRLTPGALAAFAAEFADHPEAAMLGPSLLDDDGRIQPSCGRFPTAGGTLVHETGVWKLLRRTPLAAASQPFFDPGRGAQVDWVLGAAMALRRSAFEAVGGFDPSFFMYYEEVDLCRRLAETGATTRYVPSAHIHHVGGASTRRDAPAMQRTMFRSLATYTRRHGHDAALLRLRGAVAITAMVKMLRDLVLGSSTGMPTSRISSARASAPILRDALRGWPS